MGTEVLRPQNCLVERLRVSPSSFHRRKNHFSAANGHGYAKSNQINTTTTTNSSIYGYRNQAVVRTDQKKRHYRPQPPPEPTNSKRFPSLDCSKAVTKHQHHLNNSSNHDLMMGKVMILRRGESLDSLFPMIRRDSSSNEMIHTKAEGPERPKMLPKQIRVGLGQPIDVYAGSAISSSPSPSSLPLPTFFNKKREFKSFDDSATRDLRRLLRLD